MSDQPTEPSAPAPVERTAGPGRRRGAYLDPETPRAPAQDPEAVPATSDVAAQSVDSPMIPPDVVVEGTEADPGAPSEPTGRAVEDIQRDLADAEHEWATTAQSDSRAEAVRDRVRALRVELRETVRAGRRQ